MNDRRVLLERGLRSSALAVVNVTQKGAYIAVLAQAPPPRTPALHPSSFRWRRRSHFSSLHALKLLSGNETFGLKQSESKPFDLAALNLAEDFVSVLACARQFFSSMSRAI